MIHCISMFGSQLFCSVPNADSGSESSADVDVDAGADICFHLFVDPLFKLVLPAADVDACVVSVADAGVGVGADAGI